jgi:hypothetical protein
MLYFGVHTLPLSTLQLHNRNAAFGVGRPKSLSQQYLNGPCGCMCCQYTDTTVSEVLITMHRPLNKYYCLERI